MKYVICKAISFLYGVDVGSGVDFGRCVVGASNHICRFLFSKQIPPLGHSPICKRRHFAVFKFRAVKIAQTCLLL